MLIPRTNRVIQHAAAKQGQVQNQPSPSASQVLSRFPARQRSWMLGGNMFYPSTDAAANALTRDMPRGSTYEQIRAWTDRVNLPTYQLSCLTAAEGIVAFACWSAFPQAFIFAPETWNALLFYYICPPTGQYKWLYSTSPPTYGYPVPGSSGPLKLLSIGPVVHPWDAWFIFFPPQGPKNIWTNPNLVSVTHGRVPYVDLGIFEQWVLLAGLGA